MFLVNVLLALSWIALAGVSGSGFFANLAFGFLLGYGLIALTIPTVAARRYVKKAPRVVRFVPYVLWELVLANLKMAGHVLGPREKLRPGIVGIPLDLESDAEITLLANLITLTPGTLSLEVSKDRKTLFVHSVHMEDVESFRREIKDGFETRVREVFA